MAQRIISLCVAAMFAVGSAQGACGDGKCCSHARNGSVGSESLSNPGAASSVSSAKAGSGTMERVFTAEKLFTCPMHPEVVTDNISARCPKCGMNLKAMTPEATAQLRSSHPKGCPMCPVVVKGDSPMTKCPVCGMKLVEIGRNTAE